MEITEKNIKELGFIGRWYAGEGFVANKNGYSIIIPHNILTLPNKELVWLKDYEHLLSILNA